MLQLKKTKYSKMISMDNNNIQRKMKYSYLTIAGTNVKEYEFQVRKLINKKRFN
jgi:hypothetical protein